MPLPSFATNSNAPTVLTRIQAIPGKYSFTVLFCILLCSLSDVDIPPLATLLCTESRSVCTLLWAMLIVNLEFCEFHSLSLSLSFTHECSLCLLFVCLNVHVCCAAAAAAEYEIVSVNAICWRALLCARSLLDKCECRMRGICQV